jgi:short-subunit dehydrogenase involved in D-alanine esterification of teichoic acids
VFITGRREAELDKAVAQLVKLHADQIDILFRFCRQRRDVHVRSC